MKIKNKVVIITGAASGIGKETAIMFSNEGAIVNLIDINKKTLLKILNHKNILKQNLFYEDVSNYKEMKKVVKKTVDKYGRIDVLVNNAGVAISGTVMDTNYEDYRIMTDTNFGGAYNLMSLVLPHMRKKNNGKIINVASDLGFKATSNGAVYSATKAAIIQLTKSSAIDERKYGVQINAICPDAVDTPLFRKFRTKKQINKIVKSMPKGMLKPKRIAEEILKIALDSYTKTGQAIYINK